MTEEFWPPEMKPEDRYMSKEDVAYLGRLRYDLLFKHILEQEIEDEPVPRGLYSTLFVLPTGNFVTLDHASLEVKLHSR